MGLRRGQRAALVLVTAGTLFVAAPTTSGAGQSDEPLPSEDATWRMHPIDGRWRGANALGRADVNGDGFDDYGVNYEFDQRYVVYLHPGADPAKTGHWTAVDLVPSTLQPGKGVASESAALGDLDGDGNVDLVGAQSGDPLDIIGYEPGIRVFWGPPAGQAADPGAWVDAGRITETVDAGHYHWVTPHDVDADDDLDLLVGGRVLFTANGDPTGVLWIESPDDPAARRDLSQWRVHEIDGDQLSGHQALPTDVDEDGDDDVVLANADFDTPDEREEVVWYENPGNDTDAQRSSWRKRRIYKSPDFTVKPQLGIGDLDDDGHVDLVTQTPKHLLVFRKTSVDPVRFETIKVLKDPAARWTPRTVRVGDFDGDGRLDVMGMLSHENANVPIDKASVYWMEFDGKRPTADNWTTHVIAWGPGRAMATSSLGSKWDQAHLVDVDADGDTDIVANNEEWWVQDQELIPFDDPLANPESMSVVWFENRLDERPSGCRSDGETCVIEAEDATRIADGTWPTRGQIPGSVGTYAQVFNGVSLTLECQLARIRREECPPTQDGALTYGATRGLEFDFDVPEGEYQVWLRAYVPPTFSSSLGAEKSDSAWISVADQRFAVGDGTAPGAWTWVRAPKAIRFDDEPTTLTLRARERGFAVDRVLVTRDPDLEPTGAGPEQ